MGTLDSTYWEERIVEAGDEAHRAVCKVAGDRWNEVQAIHRPIIRQAIGSTKADRPSLLDVGCNWGTVLDLIDGVDYHGVDLCRAFIDHDRRTRPDYKFDHVLDYSKLPFEDGQFCLAICRGLDGPVKSQYGFPTWRRIEAEILRVAGSLLILSYSHPDCYRLNEADRPTVEGSINHIVRPGGHLDWRAGQDGTVELYDLLVEDDSRRKGIGRHLVKDLIDLSRGSVYGYTRSENQEAIAFYKAVGFDLIDIPGFYRGSDGVMFLKPFLRGDR